MNSFLALFVVFHCRLVSALSHSLPFDVAIIEQTFCFCYGQECCTLFVQKKKQQPNTKKHKQTNKKHVTRLMTWRLLALFQILFLFSERPIKIAVFYTSIDWPLLVLRNNTVAGTFCLLFFIRIHFKY